MWLVLSTIVGLFMAVTMIFVRLRASKKPASVRKIILPPIFMSTGAFMFVFPIFRVSWMQVLESLSVGALFSIFLIWTSRFEVRQREIFLIPSKAFIFVLAGLLILRISFKLIFSQVLPLGELSGMFFLLAFGMIATWRIAMLIKFLKLKDGVDQTITMEKAAVTKNGLF